MATTLTDASEITYTSFSIEKSEVNGDGDIVVYGKCSDGGIDHDQQQVSPAWMAKAAREWMATGPNLRVNHNAQRDPAGIGLEVSTDDGGATWLKGLVVEPVAKTLVSKGALRAFSVGISRPTIERDVTGKARGGVITDGSLVEISLVDRPANARCGFQLVKSAADGTAEYTGTVFGDEAVIAKFTGPDVTKGASADMDFTMPADMSISFTPDDLMKIVQSKIVDRHYDELAVKALRSEEAEILGKDHREFSEEQRREHASEGNALPDGSYPVPDKDALRRAAILARSKHGNYQAASRLIARRARELGVPNPMDDNDDSSAKGASVTDAAVTAASDNAVKEAEPVITKDPDDVAPAGKKKPKKGKKVPPWMQDDAEKSAKDPDNDGDDDSKPSGDDDGDSASCKMDHAHTGKCMPSGTPQSTSGAKDAAPMKEIPNTSHAPESPAPAGLRTADLKGAGMDPEQSALLRFKAIGMDSDLGRLHDLTCPAFSPDDVAKYHPYASFASLVDEDLWMRKAVDAAAGPMDRAMELAQAWQAAQILKNADPAELNDFRAELHKAFRDANPGPSSYPSPGAMSPQRYCRPVITAGHAANSPGYGSPNTSPQVASESASASSFDRPPLDSGHQSPSPSFMKGGWEYPDETGKPVRLQFAQLEKDRARRALVTLHDHLQHQFPQGCPMIEQDPYRIEDGRGVPPVQGIGKSDEAAPEGTEAVVTKGMRRKLGKKVLAGKMTVDEARSKLGRKVTQKAQDIAKGTALKGEIITLTQAPAVDPDLIKSAVADAIAPLLEKISSQEELLGKQASQLSEHEARWEAAANRADPMTASFSGLALNPVNKNARPAGIAAVAENAERAQQMIMRQLRKTAQMSENPYEREAARAELGKFESGITD